MPARASGKSGSREMPLWHRPRGHPGREIPPLRAAMSGCARDAGEEPAWTVTVNLLRSKHGSRASARPLSCFLADLIWGGSCYQCCNTLQKLQDNGQVPKAHHGQERFQFSVGVGRCQQWPRAKPPDPTVPGNPDQRCSVMWWPVSGRWCL